MYRNIPYTYSLNQASDPRKYNCKNADFVASVKYVSIEVHGYQIVLRRDLLSICHFYIPEFLPVKDPATKYSNRSFY